MNIRTVKMVLSGAVFFLLLGPAIAPIFSPKFRSFMSTVIADPGSQTVQVEILRRATPIWSGGISLYNTTLYRLGISPNPNQMVMGKDGYMFLGNDHVHAYDQITHRHNLPQSHIDDWVRVLEYERDYLAKRGIPMLFVVAPSTGTIYADKIAHLPDGFTKTPTLFDRVLEQTAKKNLPLLDVRATLIEARKNAETYSKLNSHWNDYGAWVAWQKIAPQIDILDKDNEANQLLNVDVKNDWAKPVFVKPFPSFYFLDERNQQTLVSGDTAVDSLELPKSTFSPEAKSNVRALVITDSMGKSLSPYWTASFRDLMQVQNHVRPYPSKLDFEGAVLKFRPTFVLYVMTERYLALPLGEFKDVRLSEAFEAPHKLDDHLWPGQGDEFSPVVSAVENLSEPSPIDLAKTTGKRFIKIDVYASGEGAIYTGYAIDGAKAESWHELSFGQNSILLAIPEKIDRNFIWVVRDISRAKVKLTSVLIRKDE
jgi:hypothetical protein